MECPPPLLPVKGHLANWVVPPKNGMYGVGDLVQYGCKDPFFLQGEASIVCTETGFWSHPPPFCVEKSDDTIDAYSWNILGFEFEITSSFDPEHSELCELFQNLFFSTSLLLITCVSAFIDNDVFLKLFKFLVCGFSFPWMICLIF